MKPSISIFILFITIAITFAIISKDLYEEDSTTHFLMAKYSIKHPWLLVNIWARPIPTILHSLPAQLGIYFSKMFQILVGLFTGIIILLLGKKIALKRDYCLLVLLFFQPFFFLTSYNVLTEPFFALILTLSLYFLYVDKIAFSMISLSFLPLTRPEGYLVFPVIIIWLLVNKKIKMYYFLLLSLGSFIWWFAGTIIYTTPLWFIEYFPWSGSPGYYGFGRSLDYVFKIPWVISYIGLPFLIYGFLKLLNRKEWLIPVIFIIFIGFFSLIWYRGILRASLCPRYFAILSPLMAIMMVKGLEEIPEPIGIIILGCYIAISLHTVHRVFPFSIYPDHLTIKETFDWYEKNTNQNTKLMCSYPYFYHIANMDPYDFEAHPLPKIENLKQLRSGDVIIWDSNFMIKEIGVDSLKNLNFTESASFKNENGFTVKILTR